MASDYKNCDPNELKIASRCFVEPCLSEAEREAIDILVRVRELLAVNGRDLTDPTTLQAELACWNCLAPNERKAIGLYIDLQNALYNNATFPNAVDPLNPDINELKAASRCYLCIPKQIRRGLMLALKCALNAEDEPE